jgi:hypothetical protein
VGNGISFSSGPATTQDVGIFAAGANSTTGNVATFDDYLIF